MSYAILAIASPADGVSALRRICSALPQHLPIPAVCLQQFLSGAGVEDIIPRSSSLCARYATDGERVEAGCMLFAPRGRAIVVDRDHRIVLAERDRGPGLVARLLSPLGDNGHANGPADHFLHSIAQVYGPQALVLLLTGWGADGLVGAHEVHEAGGTLIVQSRGGMPYRDTTQMLGRAHVADASLESSHIATALTRFMFGEWRTPRADVHPRVQTG